jgi:mono/diheme cytochrome c family protein
MMKKAGWLLTLVAATSAGGLTAAWAADAAAGKAVYTKSCQTCHGADGQGNPAVAKAMKVELKPLGSDDIQKKSDADLKKIITDGSGKMKGEASLKPADVDNVVAHLRTLKK